MYSSSPECVNLSLGSQVRQINAGYIERGNVEGIARNVRLIGKVCPRSGGSFHRIVIHLSWHRRDQREPISSEPLRWRKLRECENNLTPVVCRRHIQLVLQVSQPVCIECFCDFPCQMSEDLVWARCNAASSRILQHLPVTIGSGRFRVYRPSREGMCFSRNMPLLIYLPVVISLCMYSFRSCGIFLSQSRFTKGSAYNFRSAMRPDSLNQNWIGSSQRYVEIHGSVRET